MFVSKFDHHRRHKGVIIRDFRLRGVGLRAVIEIRGLIFCVGKVGAVMAAGEGLVVGGAEEDFPSPCNLRGQLFCAI